MKSGIGICAVSVGSLKMAAVVVLNALGDIFNPETGQKIAGLLDPERKHFSDTCEELYRFSQQADLLYWRNRAYLIQYHHRSNHYQWKILKSPVKQNRIHDTVRLCPMH